LLYDTSELAAVTSQERYFDNPYQELLLHCLRSSSYPFCTSCKSYCRHETSAWAAATAIAKTAEAAIRDLLYLYPVCRPHTLPLLWLRQQNGE